MRRGTAPRADHTAAIDRALSAAAPSPLALVGRSGCGKTHLLRTQFALRGVQPTWTTGRDLVQAMVEAIRRSGRGTDTLLADDPRPLVVEHLEDLRGMPRTLHELRLLLEARHRRGLRVFLTMTHRRGAGDVVRWLGRCADVIHMSPRRAA